MGGSFRVLVFFKFVLIWLWTSVEGPLFGSEAQKQFWCTWFKMGAIMLARTLSLFYTVVITSSFTSLHPFPTSSNFCSLQISNETKNLSALNNMNPSLPWPRLDWYQSRISLPSPLPSLPSRAAFGRRWRTRYPPGLWGPLALGPEQPGGKINMGWSKNRCGIIIISSL